MIAVEPEASECISQELIDTICSRLAQGKPVRSPLPLGGRLHIDRPLPFLCVYRQPGGARDAGTAQLVLGEAAHLIVAEGQRLKPDLAALLKGISQTLVAQFNAFLILEIWAGPDFSGNGLDPWRQKPAFRIISSRVRPPTAAIEALEHALSRIRILKQSATVSLDFSKKRAPAGLPMLLSTEAARQANCFVLGLEVQPIYRDGAKGQLYPMVLRRLHRGLAGALKQAFFEFSRSQTSYRPSNYQALGRRGLVKSVWNVDRQLAEIGNAFDFLLQVTPVNIDQAFAQFKQAHCERPPTLYYRPLPVDPALLKRKLYQIPLERIEDPTLGLLFGQKRAELDRQLTMLSERGSQKFLYGSLQLYGPVSDELGQLATTLLEKISPRSREAASGRLIKASAFAGRARAELAYYRQSQPELAATVQLRDDTIGLMVSHGNLLIGKETEIPESRVEALLQHEIGTHIVTYFNGRSQPFHQLYSGLAGYDELQEGLAVLAEYLVGGLSRPRLRLLAGRVVAAQCLIEGASFVETFRRLYHTCGFKQRTAFTITVRTYRGGGLTKDAVYLRGLVDILKYIYKGGELEPLFVGKIAAKHIPLIHELQSRQVLQPPLLRPRYLDRPETVERLARLRHGMSVLDLIEKEKKRK
ncbi:MAG: flavohemoglobin expression-modulating QEGLA motif protein [Anaerolineae bacterium]|nr:flavohemoglobin expression-modulating QEGLA motif protein [Anaerolineae bacterium]